MQLEAIKADSLAQRKVMNRQIYELKSEMKQATREYQIMLAKTMETWAKVAAQHVENLTAHAKTHDLLLQIRSDLSELRKLQREGFDEASAQRKEIQQQQTEHRDALHAQRDATFAALRLQVDDLSRRVEAYAVRKNLFPLRTSAANTRSSSAADLPQ